MIASFLITLREVIEASLIVATILGVLVKLNQGRGVRTVWSATALAVFFSVVLLGATGVFGARIRESYSGSTGKYIEGTLMAVSAVFVTWAVFFLHTYFAGYKTRLLVKIGSTVTESERRGLFLLTFTAVFREGLEIVLFLSSIFISSEPISVLAGFAAGMIGGIMISLGVFAATVRLPVRYAFRVTSLLLIFFAAGLFARGVHELSEAGVFPLYPSVSLTVIPAHSSFAGSLIQAIFGISKTMDVVQIVFYCAYVTGMVWWVFLHRKREATSKLAEPTL